jgi:hypothetical protein
MAIQDLTPFGTLPSAYQGLLGAEETAALQKRAQIQGLLGAGLALAQGMSAYGPPRSALQNIIGAVAGGFQGAGGAYEGGIKQRMSAQQMIQQQRMMQGAEQLKMKYPDLATMIDTNLPGAMRIIADIEQEKRQPKLTSAKPGEVLVDPSGRVVFEAPMGASRQGGILTPQEAQAMGLPTGVIYQRTADGQIKPVEGTGAKAPEIRDFADGTTRQYNPATQKFEIIARKPVGEGAAKSMYASQPTVDASGRLVFLPTRPGLPVVDAQTGRPVGDYVPPVKQVQLPAAIQKQEDEDYDRGQTAINIASDSNRYINSIRSGAIPFGAGSSTMASVRGALGSNDPSVINKKDFEAFKVRLVNESLRLNKGTQTDTDAKRAVDELQAANSATGAAKAINTLMEINLRAANDAQNSIIRRRRNSKLGDPEVPLDIPKFEPHTFTQTDVNNLLKDPKYPKGTIFVDPDGVRRVKP